MNRYNHFLKKVMEKYNCTRKDADKGLQLAYLSYLSIDEIEDFILHIQLTEIKRQEMILNKKFVTTKIKNKDLNSGGGCN